MEWAVSEGEVPYEQACAVMEARAAAISDGKAPELVWLLEHPEVYTAGTSADLKDVLNAHGVPIVVTNRGGQVTYHGPGQRIIYVMVDIKKRFQGDVRMLVETLEAATIGALDSLGVAGQTLPGKPGVWVSASPLTRTLSSSGEGISLASPLGPSPRRSGFGRTGGERRAQSAGEGEVSPGDMTPKAIVSPDESNVCPGTRNRMLSHSEHVPEFAKIAALGLRVRRGVSFHGLALSINPDLSRFEAIVPCGLPGSQTTSLAALNVKATKQKIDLALKAAFAAAFGVKFFDAEPPK